MFVVSENGGHQIWLIGSTCAYYRYSQSVIYVKTQQKNQVKRTVRCNSEEFAPYLKNFWNGSLLLNICDHEETVISVRNILKIIAISGKGGYRKIKASVNWSRPVHEGAGHVQ